MFADVAETYGRTLASETIEATRRAGRRDRRAGRRAEGHRHGRVRRGRRPRADARLVAGARRRQASSACAARPSPETASRGQRAVPVADRTHARAGRRAPARARRQAARRQARRVRRRPRAAGAGPRLRMGRRPRPRPASTRPATTRSTPTLQRSTAARSRPARRTSSTRPTRPTIATHRDRAHEGSGRHDDHPQHRPVDPGEHHRRRRRSRTTSRSG